LFHVVLKHAGCHAGKTRRERNLKGQFTENTQDRDDWFWKMSTEPGKSTREKYKSVYSCYRKRNLHTENNINDRRANSAWILPCSAVEASDPGSFAPQEKEKWGNVATEP
jgi:hypothetical protein